MPFNDTNGLPSQPALGRRTLVMSAAAMLLSTMCLHPALAQDQTWPAAKPIRLIVPFPAGGTTDVIARLVAAEMEKDLKQSIVVDNKPGANGTIGSEQAAKAPADGYTLLLSGVGSHAISYALYPKLGYSDASFKHLSLIATGPNVIVVNNEFPAKSLKDVIALAKAAPGRYSYASAGAGSSGNLTMELLKQKAGIDMTHIPYKGFGPATTDVIGGRIPVLAMNNDGALQLVKSGKLRPIAVTSKTRNAAFPDVPTMAESGGPDIDVVSFFGLTAPAGVPDAVAKKLSEAAQHAARAPKVQQYLESTGFVVVGSTSEEYARIVKADIGKYSDVVKKAGIALD